MRLYFLRHADAEDGMDDVARPLSVHGKKEAAAVGNFLKTAQIQFDAVYSSPLVRAKSTAEIVVSTSQPETTVVETTDVLRNETRPAAFEKWLGELKGDDILFVGHAPSLAVRARKLLGIKDSEAIDLPKAGLVGIETHRTHGILFLYVTPASLGMVSSFGS
jgi:phosphohistidine phosphatase